MKNQLAIAHQPWNVRWLAAAKAAASVMILGPHSLETQQEKKGA